MPAVFASLEAQQPPGLLDGDCDGGHRDTHVQERVSIAQSLLDFCGPLSSPEEKPKVPIALGQGHDPRPDRHGDVRANDPRHREAGLLGDTLGGDMPGSRTEHEALGNAAQGGASG